MTVRVECGPSAQGEPEPVVLWLGRRRLQVLEVVDRWFAPAMRWFKVHTEDGQLYVLRLDEHSGRWELAALTRQADAPNSAHPASRGPRMSH
ncbi:hypothetical protein [Ideonella sp. BN130291]|uniref:hypothetical protein n=1 Tax=Ideonella sp. BN130291 TaxID=3112940 RepID=UPI002E258FA1|nr:hypothetical protein [Ideonella sp. BN130291]